MQLLHTRNYPVRLQYMICVALVLIVSSILFLAESYIGYRVIALLLLMTVSFIAMLFEIWPVIVAAVLSAFIWNFFFIPPLYTFHIDNAEDVLMFLLYFVIAFVNAVLTSKIRGAENKARDREEKANSIKLYNTLLSSLSHELRTPISAIIGAIDTLKENKETLTPQNQAELLTVIDSAGMRLNRQVENLLNMSRLESGMLKVNIDWCDVGEMIHNVMQKFSQEKNAIISFTSDENLPFFRLDAGLVEQAVNNLLHNAILYSPAPAKIELSVIHQDNSCVITVSDHGKGFQESEIPLVFDKFYRIPNTKTSGSGLGLSIVKGVVEAHGGTVSLENNSNGGATFTMKFPAEATYINSLKNE